MGDHAQLVDGIEARLAVNGMEDAVGKGEEHLVFLLREAVFLLVAVGEHLAAGDVMAGHILTDLGPVLLLAVGEVDRLEHDEPLLDGGLLEQRLGGHLDI